MYLRLIEKIHNGQAEFSETELRLLVPYINYFADTGDITVFEKVFSFISNEKKLPVLKKAFETAAEHSHFHFCSGMLAMASTLDRTGVNATEQLVTSLKAITSASAKGDADTTRAILDAAQRLDTSRKDTTRNILVSDQVALAPCNNAILDLFLGRAAQLKCTEEMLRSADFRMFSHVAASGNIEMLSKLFAIAESNGISPQEILSAGSYRIFNAAAINGKVETLDYLFNKAQEVKVGRGKILASKNAEILWSAALNGESAVISRLFEIAQELDSKAPPSAEKNFYTRKMLEARNGDAFIMAAYSKKNTVNTLQVFLDVAARLDTPEKSYTKGLLTAEKGKAISNAMVRSNSDAITFLLEKLGNTDADFLRTFMASKLKNFCDSSFQLGDGTMAFPFLDAAKKLDIWELLKSRVLTDDFCSAFHNVLNAKHFSVSQRIELVNRLLTYLEEPEQKKVIERVLPPPWRSYLKDGNPAHIDTGTLRWRATTGHDAPDSSLVELSPYGFNQRVYDEVFLPLAKRADKLEGSKAAQLNAYKLTVLFGNIDRAQAEISGTPDNYRIKEADIYMERHADRESAQPFHDVLLFDLPREGKWDIEAWKNLALKYNHTITKMLPFAPRIEEGVQERGLKLSELNPKQLREIALSKAYKRSEENINLAGLCMDLGVEESLFNESLRILTQVKKSDNIPEISIDGRGVGFPGYRLQKLPPTDPRCLWIGKIVNCCNHLAGETAEMAEAQVTSPDAGLYVITDRRDRIIGKTTVWVSNKGNVVFNSWERPGAEYDSVGEAMLLSAGIQILKANPKMERVLLGTNRGNGQFDKITDPESPRTAGTSSSDANEQYLVVSRKTLAQAEHRLKELMRERPKITEPEARVG